MAPLLQERALYISQKYVRQVRRFGKDVYTEARR